MPCPFCLILTLASFAPLRENILFWIRIISRQDAKAQSSEIDSHQDRRQSRTPQSVSLKHAVVRNHSQLLHARLRNEHPIKRIAV